MAKSTKATKKITPTLNPTTTTEDIKLSDIEAEDEIQQRINTSNPTVNDYAEMIEGGYEFPPLIVYRAREHTAPAPYPMPERTVAALTALKVSSDPSPYIFMSPANLARVAAYLDSRGHLPKRCLSGFKESFPRIRDHAARSRVEWESGRSFHTLRKTFGTEMAQVVMPPELQGIMGHADCATTTDYYVGQTNLGLADKIAQCFDGAAPLKLASTA